MEDESPRICKILCPENPLKIGEIFGVEEYIIYFYGIMRDTRKDTENNISDSAIYKLLNGQRKIIRLSQYSEDENMLFKAFHELGCDYWFRQNENSLWVTDSEPELKNGDYVIPYGSYHFGKGILPSLPCNQIMNVSDYVENCFGYKISHKD